MRTQIQLTAKQYASLKLLARERGCSLAELIRNGVDLLVGQRLSPSPLDLRRRAASLSGKFRSGVKDLSRKHDEYLTRAYGE